MRSTQNEFSGSLRAYRSRLRPVEAVALAKALVLIAGAILALMMASCGDSPSSPPKRNGVTAARATPQSAPNRSETAPACHRATRELGRGIVALLDTAKGDTFIKGRYVRIDNPPPRTPTSFLHGAYVLSAWVKEAGDIRLTWVINRRMLSTGNGAALAVDGATRDGSDARAQPSTGGQSRYADAIKNTAAYAHARSCVWNASTQPDS